MFATRVKDKYRDFMRLKTRCMKSISTINKSLSNCRPPQKFGISTMNVMCVLSIERVNLGKIKSLFDDEDTKTMADEAFKTNVHLQKDHEFNNSIIVKYKYETVTIAIKLFVNGTLQISGCRCIEDALLNGQLMCRFLERMSNMETGMYTVVDFDVHMVNCNFILGVPGSINLSMLYNYINHNYRLFQRYDVTNHAGLIVTKMSPIASTSSITIMVFNNAQCIITGWKKWEELVDAYNTILFIVDEAFEKITPYDPNWTNQIEEDFDEAPEEEKEKDLEGKSEDGKKDDEEAPWPAWQEFEF